MEEQPRLPHRRLRTFLNLLWFLERHAPDPVTRQAARLAAQDEARHVAFGVGHLQYAVALDSGLRL